MDRDRRDSSGSTIWPWVGLLGWISLLTSFCFAILPGLAELPSVQSRMDLNVARGIDGGATFYTELDFLRARLLRRESTGPSAESMRRSADDQAARRNCRDEMGTPVQRTKSGQFIVGVETGGKNPETLQTGRGLGSHP